MKEKIFLTTFLVLFLIQSLLYLGVSFVQWEWVYPSPSIARMFLFVDLSMSLLATVAIRK